MKVKKSYLKEDALLKSTDFTEDCHYDKMTEAIGLSAYMDIYDIVPLPVSWKETLFLFKG